MKLIISKNGEIYTDRKISVPNHLKISSVYYRMAEFNGIDFLRIINQTFSIVWKCTYTIIMENQNSSYFD